jgi:diguanylate cyclase (GGDEF)-like protein/PAS domain S-box-containing protein
MWSHSGADTSKVNPHSWRLVPAALAVCAVAYGMAGGGLPALAVLLFACALAAAACVHGPRRNDEPNDQPWWLMGTGFLVLGGAEIVEQVGHGPSAAWVVPIRVLALLSLTVGLWLTIPQPPGGRRRGILDPAIVAIGAGVVSWVAILEPITRRTDIDVVDRLVAFSIPVLDIVLLTVAVRLLFGSGASTAPARLLLAGAGSMLAADTIDAAWTFDGLLGGEAPIRMLWIIGAGLIAAAALHPQMSDLGELRVELAQSISTTRLVMLGLAAVAGPIALIVRSSLDARFNVPVVVAGTVVLFVLILLRMAGLVRALTSVAQNHAEATGREKTLRRSAHSLVAATDRGAIYATAADAAATLVRDRPRAEVRLFVGDGDVLRLVTGRGRRGARPQTLALSALPKRVVDQLRVADSATLALEDHDVERPVAAAIAAAVDHPQSLLAPLVVDGAIAGLLSVSLDRVPGEARRRAIETVASQAALAIETAALTESLHARAGEERFRSLVQNASDVIAVIEPGGIIRFVTRSITRMLGYEPGTLEGRSISRLLHPGDVERGPSLLVDGGLVDWRLRRADGAYRHVEVIVADLRADANVAGIVLTMRDVTERRELESRLAHQAFHDTLTGLANRALFEDRLGQALARRARNPIGAVAVIFIDLDDFKTVNDTLGHQSGDALLNAASRRLVECLRPTDTAARLGGDEFAVVLEIDDFDANRAIEAVANRILAALRSPFLLDGHEVFTRGSLGIAATPDGGTTVDGLLRNADVAMYVAKNSGKGRFKRFEPGMHGPVLRQMELRGELQRAIERQQLVMYYQPIVALRSGELRGFEALVRWQHPEHGLILPSEFVSLAEEAGLIGAMGSWILEEACRQFCEWVAAYPRADGLYVSVNLSGHQLHRGNLLSELERVIRQTEMEPSRLLLELTESVLVDDTERTIARLEMIKARGVRIAIDDFGTGFSALAYLQQLPIDVLKLASPFVQGLGTGQEQLTETILRLASALDLDVIAEGIEHPDEAVTLVRLGCALGQGFHFSTPLPADEAAAVIAAGMPLGISPAVR